MAPMGLFSRKRSTTKGRAEEVEERDDEDAAEEVEPEEPDGAPEDDRTSEDDEASEDDAGDDPVEADEDHGDPEASDEDDDDEASDEDGGDAEASDEDDGEDDDDGGDDDDEDEGEGEEDELVDTGQIEFELADWGARERQMLDSELAAVRVRRAWEASTLVVAASDADVVDDLIDLIDERIALDLAPGVDTVVYGVDDWPQGLEDRFIEALIDARIAHRRDYREVAVGVDDEERVDELVEAVTAAWEDEQPDEDELDGPDAQDVLSELFVSSDRLLHDPSDKTATLRFDDASSLALAMKLPFGFDEAGWGAITDLTSTLRDHLADAEATDDDIVDAATALRTHLRPLV